MPHFTFERETKFYQTYEKNLYNKKIKNQNKETTGAS